MLSLIFLFCTDVPLVCPSLLAFKKKKNPQKKELTLIWICDKFRKYSGTIFGIPVVGMKINYVLESDF